MSTDNLSIGEGKEKNNVPEFPGNSTNTAHLSENGKIISPNIVTTANQTKLTPRGSIQFVPGISYFPETPTEIGDRIMTTPFPPALVGIFSQISFLPIFESIQTTTTLKSLKER